MRRSSLLAGLVLAGLASNQPILHAEPPVASARIIITDDQPAKDAAPATPIEADHDSDCRRRWSIYGDLLLLAPRGETVPFAQIRDGEGPLAVPRGGVGQVDADYSPGYRIGGSVGFEHVTLTANFAYYDNTSHGAIAVANGDPFIITALTTHPNTINAAADSLAAQASLDVRFITGDVNALIGLCGSDCYRVSLLLGGRYGHLDQDFTAQYQILGATQVDTQINFDGGGPRVGLDGRYNVGRRGFLFASRDVSFLFGHWAAKYLQQNVFAGEQARTTFSDDRFTPLWQTELGVGWTSKNDRFEVMAGYTAQVWFNAMTTSSWIQGVQDGVFQTNRDNLRDTLSFDGLFVRAAFKY